jgi:hypothetical protein
MTERRLPDPSADGQLLPTRSPAGRRLSHARDRDLPHIGPDENRIGARDIEPRRMQRPSDAAPSFPEAAQGAGSTVADRRFSCDTRPFPTPWLTYPEAAAYCGWSVGYLRNLVSARQVPVYGKPRVRRFRRDMLDLFLTDPDAAMRSFRAERNAHGS